MQHVNPIAKEFYCPPLKSVKLILLRDNQGSLIDVLFRAINA